MSQATVVLADIGPRNMHDEIDAQINPALLDLLTNSAGTSAPTGGPGGAPAVWQLWVDTSTTPATLRMYVGSGTWAPIGTVSTGGVFTPAGMASAISAAVAAEAARAGTAEGAEVTRAGAAESAEATRAEAAEAAEATRAGAAEGAEATARGNADTTEASNRAAGDSAEIAARKAAFDAMLPLLADQRYAYAVIDPSGYPVFGADWQSRLDFDRAPPPFRVYPVGAIGSRRAYAWAPNLGEVDISTGEFDDVVDVLNGGNFAYYLGRNSGGAPVARECLLHVTSTLSPSVTDLVGLIIHGQSLAVGANTVTTINTAPLYPGRAVMFNGGVRVHGREHDDPLAALDLRQIKNWVDLAERQDTFWGETVASQAAATFLLSAPSTTGIVAATSGVGAQPFTALGPGTQAYVNLLTIALRMVQVARLTHKALAQICVFWRQGESDGALSEAAYTTDLLSLQSALNTDIKRITGQSTDVVLIVDQVSAFSDLESAGPTLAELTAAVNNPTKIASLGPKYQFPYTDGLHLSAVGQAWSGAYLGRFLKRMLLDGVTPQALHIASATLSGSTIHCTVAGNVGNIAIDATFVNNPGGSQPHGILFRDSTTSATVTAVTVTGANTFDVTLSGAPTGTNKRLLVAGLQTSSAVDGSGHPRSTIRDSATESVTVSGVAHPLYNPLAHQVALVT